MMNYHQLRDGNGTVVPALVVADWTIQNSNDSHRRPKSCWHHLQPKRAEMLGIEIPATELVKATKVFHFIG